MVTRVTVDELYPRDRHTDTLIHITFQYSNRGNKTSGGKTFIIETDLQIHSIMEMLHNCF